MGMFFIGFLALFICFTIVVYRAQRCCTSPSFPFVFPKTRTKTPASYANHAAPISYLIDPQCCGSMYKNRIKPLPTGMCTRREINSRQYVHRGISLRGWASLAGFRRRGNSCFLLAMVGYEENWRVVEHTT
jgi:hypothetical protein